MGLGVGALHDGHADSASQAPAEYLSPTSSQGNVRCVAYKCVKLTRCLGLCRSLALFALHTARRYYLLYDVPSLSSFSTLVVLRDSAAALCYTSRATIARRGQATRNGARGSELPAAPALCEHTPRFPERTMNLIAYRDQPVQATPSTVTGASMLSTLC